VRIEKQFVRFLLVGILNTLFGLAIYAVLIWLGLPIWGALLGGNVAGIAFNFFTTGHLIFSDIALSRLPRFIGAYLTCYLVNYLSINTLVWAGLGAIEGQALLAPLIAVLSYYLMSQHVFRSDRP
jgi:putative flippase GtrA